MRERRWLIDALGGEVRIELDEFSSSDHAVTTESEREHANVLREPAPGAINPVLSTPAFYFRLRWTGRGFGPWVERLQVLDLSPVTGVRG